MRRQAARAALLGAGVHAAAAHEAARQPALLPAPRGADDPPHPRPAVRPGLHDQRRAQQAHRRGRPASRTRPRRGRALRSGRARATRLRTTPRRRRSPPAPATRHAHARDRSRHASPNSTTRPWRRWPATTWPSSSARNAASASSRATACHARTSVPAGHAGVRAAALQTRRSPPTASSAPAAPHGAAVDARPDPRRTPRDPRAVGQLTTFFAASFEAPISRAILRGSVGA